MPYGPPPRKPDLTDYLLIAAAVAGVIFQAVLLAKSIMDKFG